MKASFFLAWESLLLTFFSKTEMVRICKTITEVDGGFIGKNKISRVMNDPLFLR